MPEPERHPVDSSAIQWLIALMSALGHVSQRELGIVTGSIRKGAFESVANHPPETRADTVKRVEHTIGGLLTTYVSAIEEALAEDHGLTADDRRRLWEDGLDQDDHDVLMALRHIRNTAAHGYEGSRANTGYEQFDRVATSRLRHLWDAYDAEHIILNSSAGFHAGQELVRLSQMAISKLA